MGSILDAAGVLGLPKPNTIRVEQNTYGKQSFLKVTLKVNKQDALCKCKYYEQ